MSELEVDQSRQTSPLRIPSSSDVHIADSSRVSKDDFSYLQAKLTPTQTQWTPLDNEHLAQQRNLDEFIDADHNTNSESSSIFEYTPQDPESHVNEVHGILEFTDSKQHPNKVILSQTLNLQADNVYMSDEDDDVDELQSETSSSKTSPLKSLSTLAHRTHSELDTTNNTSSFMNSSVPTQDLHDVLRDNSSILPPRHSVMIEDDITPIVHQESEFISTTPTENTFPQVRRESINTEDLKLNSKAINEIFANGSGMVSDSNVQTQKTLTPGFSNLGIANPQNRVQSTTSSIYSELPNRNTPDYNSGLRSFRTSAFKPVFHKHLSQPLEDMELKEEEEEGQTDENDSRLQFHQNGNLSHPVRNSSQKVAFTNSHASIDENEQLDFSFSNMNINKESSSPKLSSFKQDDMRAQEESELAKQEREHKTRVSVLNQSIYQKQYDARAAPSTNQTTLSTLESQDNVQNMLRNSTTHTRSSELSFTPSNITNATNEPGFEEEDASALFVTAIYAFNSESLESENDSSICLSFDQDEIAFTYNLDDSGWGEVTLLSSLKRGWVPMNYFRSTVATEISEIELKNMPPLELTDTRSPLKMLLKNAGTFLLNPQSKPVYIENELRGYTFDVECFNGITDGIRKLLIDTDCISRSNSVVQNKPVVRKIRKKLLRGWADLIAKGKDYMGTIATTKIEYLQLLTFHLLQKAITFLDIWGLEQERINAEEDQYQSQMVPRNMQNNVKRSETKLGWDSMESVSLNIVYLDKPPALTYRVNELYNQLITYLCLISGRIDLVEHNPQSFTTVAIVLSHINLLINEYFFIIKLLKTTLNEQEGEKRLSKNMSKYGKLSANMNVRNQLNSLDHQTEKLRQMVEELNTYIRILHNVARKDHFNRGVNNANPSMDQSEDLYFYSREGGAVVVCACKMIELCSNAYYILKNTLFLNDQMILPNSRKYPDYFKMNISPEQFIKNCTKAMAQDTNVRKQVSKYKRDSRLLLQSGEQSKVNNRRASQKYSIFKTGNSTDVQLNSNGLDFLSHFENTDGDADSPFLPQNGFDDAQDSMSDDDFNVENELLRSDKDNKIIGASFRALIYMLTDESNPPSYFFISTFFLTFRIFSDSAQLLEALIRRFDVNDSFKNKQTYDTNSLTESKIRSRRKLVTKFFKVWMESYWNSKTDYVLLAPIMNFANEGMKRFLPIESYQLLVIASKLIGHPPVESNIDRLNYHNNISNNQQLLPRKVSSRMQQKTMSKMSMGVNSNGLLNEIEAYNAFLDDIEIFELEKVDTSAPLNANSRASVSLSLNIELRNSNSNSVLLTKQQLSMMKMVIMSYRRMLGRHWYKNYVENTFEPLDSKTLIESWWGASQESWKILNDDLTLLNFNGLEIAKQLTLIESKLFCSIQVGELLNQNFTTKKLHLNLSPNIQKSILFTNLLSDYVIESILKPRLHMRQRIHAFKCWLKIGISCLYLRNFNSLASIMTSLQSFLITRITSLWDGLSDKYKELFHYLASIIHPNKNYNTYRERLRDFLDTNTQDNIDIPIVPYLSLFLQDLTFIVDGNPNYRENTKSFLQSKLINIDKYSKITEIVADLQALQVSYKDTGELGKLYNDKNTDIVRSETIKNLKKQMNENSEVSFTDMFDINGVPILQELILLEIWKVKQTNAKDDDRSWKLSCAIQPRELEK